MRPSQKCKRWIARWMAHLVVRWHYVASVQLKAATMPNFIKLRHNQKYEIPLSPYPPTPPTSLLFNFPKKVIWHYPKSQLKRIVVYASKPTALRM